MGGWTLTGGGAADEASKYNSSTRGWRLAGGFSSELQAWKLGKPRTESNFGSDRFPFACDNTN